MNGFAHLDLDHSEFVEVDPTGRYGRYDEILGKGASKTVYRAFDEYEGIEVAWNQVKLFDFLQSPEDLERLYCEIHLLKTLKHQNIMKFYTSWVDTAKRNINFVTEMFTSGTLRQYRQKHKKVNIRAVKHWCRQILRGLHYLHSHDPPVIHRDLKCDNIFVNGNQGQVKIGDLGLAAVLRKSTAAHCVGTPEFMAPEVYEEEYNELVDIYSFGMCVLEMVTFEYPYSECSHPAHIYKKVISGKKPDALYKVKDLEVRQFIEKCLANVSIRQSAKELLNDPFLQTNDCEINFQPIECLRDLGIVDPILRHSFPELDYKRNPVIDSPYNEYSNGVCSDDQNEWGYQKNDMEQNGIDLFEYNGGEHEEHFAHVDITIKGKRKEDGSIFLRLRISDKEDHIRNIYFSFDIELDTALSVATEMVGELDITDQDVTKIADMIDGEIANLVPGWKTGPGIEETPRFANSSFCDNCASNHTSTGSFMNFLSDNPSARHMQIINCCGNGCASMHGRFEEVTYAVDSPRQNGSHNAKNQVLSGQSNGFHQEYWNQHESVECSELGSEDSHSGEEHETLEDKELTLDSKGPNSVKTKSLSDDYELEIQKELRWLKAKYQMGLRELRDQQMGFVRKSSEHRPDSQSTTSQHKTCKGTLLKSSNSVKKSSSIHYEYVDEDSFSLIAQGVQNCEMIKALACAEDTVIPESFYTPALLHRTTSLPVDI